MNDSDVPRHFSTRRSSEWKLMESTLQLTTRSRSAMSTSEKIFTPTLSSPAEPPCTPALPIEWQRNWRNKHRQQWKLRLSHRPSENTPVWRHRLGIYESLILFSLDWWFDYFISVDIKTNVDFETRIRRVWSLNCSQKMFPILELLLYTSSCSLTIKKSILN